MTLKVGVIGLGSMGKNHLRVIEKVEGLKLTGVYDPIIKDNSMKNSSLVFRDLDSFLMQP